MTPLERDTQTAIGWLVDIATELTRGAIRHEGVAANLMDQATLVCEVAGLPGDLPLRVRCMPGAFLWRA